MTQTHTQTHTHRPLFFQQRTIYLKFHRAQFFLQTFFPADSDANCTIRANNTADSPPR